MKALGLSGIHAASENVSSLRIMDKYDSRHMVVAVTRYATLYFKKGTALNAVLY
jgi:hypothetical protein